MDSALPDVKHDTLAYTGPTRHSCRITDIYCRCTDESLNPGTDVIEISQPAIKSREHGKNCVTQLSSSLFFNRRHHKQTLRWHPKPSKSTQAPHSVTLTYAQTMDIFIFVCVKTGRLGDKNALNSTMTMRMLAHETITCST